MSSLSTCYICIFFLFKFNTNLDCSHIFKNHDIWIADNNLNNNNNVGLTKTDNCWNALTHLKRGYWCVWLGLDLNSAERKGWSLGCIPESKVNLVSHIPWALGWLIHTLRTRGMLVPKRSRSTFIQPRVCSRLTYKTLPTEQESTSHYGNGC